MPGLLNLQGSGLLNGQPHSPGWMNIPQGQAAPYGSDAWATNTGGPGAMIWREMMRYMANNGKAPLGFLDPKEKAFSPEFLQYLGPQFQRGGNGGRSAR